MTENEQKDLISPQTQGEENQDFTEKEEEKAFSSPVITPEKIDGDVSLADQPSADELTAKIDRENGICVMYDLREEEVKMGLHWFQKQLLYRRNWIYTALLTVLFCLYVITVAQKPDYSAGYLLMAVCAGVIFMIWFLPYQHRKSTSKAIALLDDRFSMTFGEEAFFIGERNSCVRIPYSGRELIRAVDMENQLVLSVGKERLFVLPKRCIEEGKYPKIQERLKEKLGANYMAEGQK